MILLALTVVLTLLLTLLLAVFAPRGRLASGRGARLLRVSGLGARMWSSALGARVRRLFAGKERRRRIDEGERRKNAQRVAETMGEMKGAFMKLGQMMSFVTDDIPEEYRTALAMLQAQAPPMDFALLRDVAERELGMPLERAFARFDEKPLASASIGQVHRAQLSSGEEVVVRIQYPGVAEAIRGDMANAAMLYRAMMMLYPSVEPGPIVDEMRGRICEELDYAAEAKSQRAFYDLYQGHPFIQVPKVVESRSSARVLTSEFVRGRRWNEVLSAGDDERQRISEILYRFIFGSITRFGVFNGDPHPGNYLFTDDGKVAFLDYGCVKYFPQQMRRDWRQLVSSHLAGERDQFVAQLKALGFLRPEDDFDRDTLYDYFGYFYEPFHEDREFTYTREYNAQSFGRVFKPTGPFAPLSRRLNMPPDFVFVNRIQWGVVSLLAQLGARNNWHRIHREILLDDPPSTALGHEDAAWRAARGLHGSELTLTPEGLLRVA